MTLPVDKIDIAGKHDGSDPHVLIPPFTGEFEVLDLESENASCCEYSIRYEFENGTSMMSRYPISVDTLEFAVIFGGPFAIEPFASKARLLKIIIQPILIDEEGD